MWAILIRDQSKRTNNLNFNRNNTVILTTIIRCYITRQQTLNTSPIAFHTLRVNDYAPLFLMQYHTIFVIARSAYSQMPKSTGNTGARGVKIFLCGGKLESSSSFWCGVWKRVVTDSERRTDLTDVLLNAVNCCYYLELGTFSYFKPKKV